MLSFVEHVETFIVDDERMAFVVDVPVRFQVSHEMRLATLTPFVRFGKELGRMYSGDIDAIVEAGNNATFRLIDSKPFAKVGEEPGVSGPKESDEFNIG
jgi:hypothetical protein